MGLNCSLRDTEYIRSMVRPIDANSRSDAEWKAWKNEIGKEQKLKEDEQASGRWIRPQKVITPWLSGNLPSHHTSVKHQKLIF